MAEEVELARKILESKGFVNDEAIDSLDARIITAQEVALVSSRNAEEVARWEGERERERERERKRKGEKKR